jgi:hypothetical protein
MSFIKQDYKKLVSIAAKNHRILTVDTYANNKQVPLISLQGKWLEKLGFMIGEKIRVEENGEGILLIKALGTDNMDGFTKEH